MKIFFLKPEKNKMGNIMCTIEGDITIPLKIKSTLCKITENKIYYYCLDIYNLYIYRLASCEF